MVISVGGDGTNNEVLGGFVDADGVNLFPEAVLGIVASGTGGDFQRMWGSREPRVQVERLASAELRTIDYGVARFLSHIGQEVVRPFLNIASVGISGLVDRYVNRSSKVLPSVATYVLASLRGIVSYENRPVVLKFEDGADRQLGLSLLVIGNGQYFGAGMWACPKAELDDGFFDTILLPDFSKPEIVTVLAKVFKAQHLDYPGLEVGRAKCISLEPAIPGAEILIDLDGEQPGRLPASFEVVPKGLKIAVA
jgi:diacylglycerol kinase family enzyme